MHAQDRHAIGNADGEKPSSISSPPPPSRKKISQANLPKPQKPNRDFRGAKRTSSDKAGSNKRRKKDTPISEGSDSEAKEVPSKKVAPKPKKRTSSKTTGPDERQRSEVSASSGSDGEEQVPVKKPVSRSSKTTSPSPEPGNNEIAGQISEGSSSSKAYERKAKASESETSEVLDEAPNTKGGKRKPDSAKHSVKANGAKASASESEMSEVLDECPKARGRKRKSDSAKPRAKKTETSKGKKSSEQSMDPDAEEIKRLQGWLIKCGIRKMWHRELAPYETPKAKIRHLKELLADAGMTGRYSLEKANQIKEERELQADLEAVQEGAKQWGKAESDGGDETSGRPKRRLAKGLQELNFLNDDDGEETD